MQAPAHPPAPAAAPNWQPLVVSTMNLLNLALPHRVFYENQPPYEPREYEAKTRWIGQQLMRLNADLVALQEVWDYAALDHAQRQSGLRYRHVLAPGTESGALGTPRVGLLTRLHLRHWRSIAEFPAGHEVEVPELGTHRAFDRPVLHARLAAREGHEIDVLVVHLKSKRPKFLQDAHGQPLENRDDPRIAARAVLRSLVMRASEAAALRSIVVELLQGRRAPLLLLGDMNDTTASVTTQIVAATSAVAFDRGACDVALWSAHEVQTEPALRRDVAYTHVHQGSPETLDQILVSEEFVASSRFAQGDVRRVDYFNDHLHEGRDRTRSDHGFVRALLRLRNSADARPPG
jgi:endonuclease/exonuclease/phosphatase family metal-dependent hydrolase